MIFIKETFPDQASVTIQVDGRLDKQALGPLMRVIEQNEGRHITLSLQGLVSISHEGRKFFEQIKPKVSFSQMSEFLKLEIGDSDCS